MYAHFDDTTDEIVAKGGTFDITGTDAVTNKQYWGFDADADTVLAVIKGIPLKTAVTTLADITSAEVNLASYFLTTLTDPLLAQFYRVDGYIITNIQLTSGTLHCYKVKEQITS
ncbi:hypothetical protein D4R42_02660 [bacterium]|nr:MAG: hypothetical protein D4R42_02660 [bacterium]